MRYVFLWLCLLPLPALAIVELSNCDRGNYEVTVTNGGAARTVAMTPFSGPIYEYGPVISFRMKGQKPVTVLEPYAEYCIWSGKIKLQRITSSSGPTGAGALR